MAEHLITLTDDQEARIEAYLLTINSQSHPLTPAPPIVGVQGFVEHAIGVVETVIVWQQMPEGA